MARVAGGAAGGPDSAEASGQAEGVLAGMQSTTWLDRAGRAGLPLLWSEPYAVVTRPLRVVDQDGREVVRAGDRIAVTGVMRDGRLLVSAAPVVVAKTARRTLPGAFFDFSPEQLARARRRGRRRLEVMLTLTTGGAGAFAFALSDAQARGGSATLVAGLCVGLAAAWTGLILGFRRQQSHPSPYDGLDPAARRDVRRAVWRGTVPAVENEDAFLVTASRSSWNRWFHGAFGTYLTTQFFIYSTSASESLARQARAGAPSRTTRLRLTGGPRLNA